MDMDLAFGDRLGRGGVDGFNSKGPSAIRSTTRSPPQTVAIRVRHPLDRLDQGMERDMTTQITQECMQRRER